MDQQNTYKILEISDEQVLETEQLGSKSKFWVSVEWYINRGSGAIFAQPDDQKGLNPFELLKFAYNQHPDIFQPWLVKTQHIDLEQFRNILFSVPDSFISDLQRRFAYRILEINLNRLKKLAA